VLALPYRWQWRLERWKNAMRGFFGGGDSQPRPKLCPSCGALVGINATRCHECGTNLRFSLAAVSKGLAGIFGGQAPVTTILLVANLIMFGIEFMAMAAAGKAGGLAILWGMDSQALFRLGASLPLGFIITTHEWWRLVTAMFLHGGLIHIGFNMMVLMDFGPPLEELYGSAKYLFFYVLTGVFGYLISSLLGHFSIGASGAILGLVGLLLAVTTKRGGAQMSQLRSRLIGWIVFLFVLGFVMRGIDNSAHLGGLAAGFVLGKISPDRQPMTPGEKQIAQLLGWLAGIVVIASFVLMFLHYRDPIPGVGA
jgi:rhomboid protease GluP